MWIDIPTNFKIDHIFGPNKKILSKRYLFTVLWAKRDGDKMQINYEFRTTKLYWGNLIKNV